jgi:hypothetical protein
MLENKIGFNLLEECFFFLLGFFLAKTKLPFFEVIFGKKHNGRVLNFTQTFQDEFFLRDRKSTGASGETLSANYQIREK